MAKNVSVITTSDLTGSENAEPVQFGLNGRTYEIDLTEAEKQELENTLKKYVEVSRATSKKGANRPIRSTTVGLSPATVRSWATNNGVDVPKRGRIPEGVLAKFQEAHTAAH